jgi:hypothetical protein
VSEDSLWGRATHRVRRRPLGEGNCCLPLIASLLAVVTDSFGVAVPHCPSPVGLGSFFGVAVPLFPPFAQRHPLPLYGKSVYQLTERQCLNYRKLELQNLRDEGNIAGILQYPKPRPLLVLTQSHLAKQISQNFAEFSDEFDVFVYGGGNKALHPNVRRIPEHLTRAHPIFDQGNECNSQVVVVASYDTLQARHGPSAILKYLKQLQYKPKVAEKHKFTQLRDRNRPDWAPPMDLDGLFEEAILDEAQNTKGLSNPASGSQKRGHMGESNTCCPPFIAPLLDYVNLFLSHVLPRILLELLLSPSCPR